MKRTAVTANALAGFWIVSLVGASVAAPRLSPSKQPFTAAPGGDEPSITSYFFGSGFEPSEGFAVGSVEPQNGWAASGVNLPWQTISTSNPYTGSQHVRFVKDPGVGQGTNRILLSPTNATPGNTPSTVYLKLSISNDGGADYYVFAQAPSQGLLTWQVVFSYSDGSNVGPGTIFVVDNVMGMLGFVNTGVVWTENAYRELRVDFNPAGGAIDYYYNGVLIHTGTLVSGTAVEQIGLLHDNFQLTGERADYDALSVQTVGEPPVAVQGTTWSRLKARMR